MNEKAATLRYRGRKTPILTAIGEDETAQQMIALAQACDIPCYQDEDLVNLLVRLETGTAIPAELYEWIAAVLAFAFFARNEVPEGFSPAATRSAYDKLRKAYSDD